MGRLRDALSAFRAKFASNRPAEWVKLAEFLGIDAKNTPRDALSEATYYTCLKVLSESFGKMPCKVVQKTEAQGSRPARDHQAWSAVALRPNPYTTAAGFWSTMEMNRCHYGNAYALIDRRAGDLRLWSLDPTSVTCWYDDTRALSDVEDVWYQWSSPRGPVMLGSEEVVHVRTSDSFDGVVGVPVITRLAATVEGNVDALRVLNKLYGSNLSQKMVLNYTSNISEDLAQQMAKLVQQYASGELRDKGIDNVIPIPMGTQLTPLNMKLADTQFLDLRKYSAIQIASAFGIKPYQIGDYGKESYSSQTAQSLAFYKDTLLWPIEEYEQELTYKLLDSDEVKDGYQFKFNTYALLRADLETQINAIVAAIAGGLYKPNEGRAYLDLDAAEGGDQLLGNGSLIPLRMAGVQYARGQEQGGGKK